MLYIRIDESVEDIGRELLKFLFREIEGREKFIIHNLADKLSDLLILAALADCIETAEISDR